MAPILGIYASQISGHLFAPSGAYDSIATTTVGAGGSSSVTFSSIPSTYTHLQLRIMSIDSRVVGNFSNIYYTLNGDTTSTYPYHQVYGDGSTAGASAYTLANSAFFGYCASATTAANVFATTILDILDYANTNKYKTSRALTGGDNNGSGVVALSSGLWMSTSAINSITITPLVANFTQYSSFALYGIKGGN
jgi:hypothetical protein